MKSKKYIIIAYALLFLCYNIYSNSVVIYSDIQKKEDVFNRTEACFSPDDKYIVHTFGKSSIYFYNIQEARISFQIEYEKSLTIENIEFSPNGKYLAVVVDSMYTRENCILYVYETKTYSLIFRGNVFNNEYDIQESRLFSSDSQYIIFCGTFMEGTELVFLNPETGYIEKHFHSRGSINEIRVSDDSKKILVRYTLREETSHYWYLWHLDKDTYIEDCTAVDWKSHLQFSPDSKYFFTRDHVWNAESGNFIKTFKSDFLGDIKTITSDNKYILMNRYGYTKVPYTEDFYEKIFLEEIVLKLYKGFEKTNKFKYDCFTNAGEAFHTNISHNLEYMVATDMRDSSVIFGKSIFELDKKEEETPICKISVFENNEWISYTPDGFYNSSVNGDKYIHIRYNLDVYDLTQFTKAYFQPDVIISRTLGLPEPKCVNYYGDILLSSPPPLIVIGENDVIDNKLSLNIKVLNNSNDEISDISVFNNGKYLGNTLNKYKSCIISENSDSLELGISITLDYGQNYIEIVANTDICYGLQTISITSDNSQRIDSDLYVLSIGIDNYDRNELQNLKHAVDDSKAIIDIFSRKNTKYQSIHIMEINDYSEIKPSKDEILNGFHFFENMTENDDAIIFIAAHSIMDNGLFYILPKDYINSNSSEQVDFSTAITIEEILSRLNTFGRKIILLDSCMSGGVGNNYVIKTMQNKSISLLTASQENELAQESSNNGGYFTQSLISYFDESDLKNYNLIDMSKYIYDEVREMSRLEKRGRVRQNPVFFIPDGFLNFSF